MPDAHESAATYFAHHSPDEGAPAGAGTWHELAAIDPISFLPGLLMRPIVGDRMLVNFATHAPGTVVPVHAHEEEQITFVLEGEFEFELDGEVRTVRPGMVAHIPPHVPHGARTLDAPCTQVDVFAPPRRVLLDTLAALRGPTDGLS